MADLKKRFVAAVLIVLVLATTPALAFALEESHPGHDAKHGPMPIAIVGSVFGGVFWLVSTPFCLLLAPKHIVDSFDLLVVAPLRRTIGTADPAAD